MKNRFKIVDKVVGLLEQARMPRWLHRFGPKKYELWQHALALLIKQECKLSYRRASSLLNGLGHTVPTYSALCKMSKRIPLSFWKLLLSCTAPTLCKIAVLDGVFFSTTNPSFHYLKRIGSAMPIRKPVQMNAIIDARTRKYIAIKVRTRRRNECIDALPLASRIRPQVLVADAAYDMESLHRYAKQHGFLTMIPRHKTTHKGFFRNYMRKRFDERMYHQRSIIEAVFSATKRRSGNCVLAKTTNGKQAELHARALAYNLNLVPSPEIFN